MSAQTSIIGRPVRDLETPVLLVDLDTLDRNAARMRDVIVTRAGVGWRPHTKGIKVPAIAHKLLQAGALGITCAKLEEAEVMAAAGVRDVLIANEVVGPSKVARLARLRRHADVAVAVDAVEPVEALDAAAREAGTRLRVLVEVNIAMDRAGVEPGEPVLSLAKDVAAHSGLVFAGLMGWEGGRLAGLRDPQEKRRAIEAAVGRLTESAERCRRAGLGVDIVSCGGTGTYEITAHLPGVTEVQAGGGIFGDVHYRKNYGVDHEYALTVLTTVVSRPTPTRIVCDAGWKSMARVPMLPEPLGLGEVSSLALSAEHATLELARGSAAPRVGEPVEFVVGYSDATVFLHDELYGVRNGQVEVIWPVLGRGKTR
jgi:D-serine deaminase-like pyridoxal phosphate-dependent protein